MFASAIARHLVLRSSMRACGLLLGEEEYRAAEEALRITAEALARVEARKGERGDVAKPRNGQEEDERRNDIRTQEWRQENVPCRTQNYCTNCGWKLLSQSDRFCGGCGAPLPRTWHGRQRITPRSTLQYDEVGLVSVPASRDVTPRKTGHESGACDGDSRRYPEFGSKDVDAPARCEVLSVPSWRTTETESSEEECTRRERMPFRMPGTAFDSDHFHRQHEAWENAQFSEKVAFLGLEELPLMLQDTLEHPLPTVFAKVFADGSGFLQNMHEGAIQQRGVKLKVTPWVPKPNLGGHVRTVVLQTVHPKLGELESIDMQFYRWPKEGTSLLYENKCVTPRFPHGDKWRIERRCTFSCAKENECLVTISAGMFVQESFPEEEKLRKAVDPTILPDCQTFLRAIKDACTSAG